jgi:putative flippase GtrA
MIAVGGLVTAQHVFRSTLLVLSLACVGGFPMVVWFQATSRSAVSEPPPLSVIVVSLIMAATVLAISWVLSRRFPPAWWDAITLRRPSFALAFAVGLALRVGLALWLAPTPASDGAAYMKLAHQLATQSTYGEEGAWSYLPPGLPLLLAPLMLLGLSDRAVLLVLGVGTYALAMWGLRQLLLALKLERGEWIAIWLFALWPTCILLSMLPEKELVIIALLPWIAERTLAASQSSRERALGAAIVAGLLCGICVLTQPSLQLLPLTLLIVTPLLARRRLRALGLSVLGIAAMLAVVAPWTLRNGQVLGTPVFVSTNGGSVLYRANNDLATGVYTDRGRVSLEHISSEIERDAGYGHLAREWITANPGRFVHLLAAKLLFFMGDDSYGVYAVFSRGDVGLDRQLYLALRLLTVVVPWMLLWVALAMLALRWRPAAAAGQRPDQEWLGAGLLLLPVAYLAGVHSVAESGPKYHLPTIPLVCVLLAAMGSLASGTAARTARPRERDEQIPPSPENEKKSRAMTPLWSSFVRFSLIGGVGTAAQYAILALMAGGLGVHAVLASQAGAAVGATVNYGLNRSFNYRSHTSHLCTGPRFALVVLAGLTLNGALMTGLVQGLSLHWLPSQVLTTVLVLLWNFGANHFWTFRSASGRTD